MKINELARRLGVTPRAIRFYEEKGLLPPGSREANGYRHYYEADAWRLQTIVALREFGLSIDTIQLLLAGMDKGNPDNVRHQLELQRSVLFSQWVQWKSVLQAMDRMIERWDEEKPMPSSELFRLADQIKELKLARSSWTDRWNYDQMAERFDMMQVSPVGLLATPSEYEQALQYTAQWISPQPGETGLDIGAGTGNLTALLLREDVQLFAVEQSKSMLARCREKLPNVTCKLGNFLALPFFEGEFDFVATSFAFHHLSGEQQLLALEEIHRVLKPLGRIVITGLMYEHSEARGHILHQLREAGSHDLMMALEDRHPSDRAELLDWLRLHGYITVQQQLNPWIHMVYGVRKH